MNMDKSNAVPLVLVVAQATALPLEGYWQPLFQGAVSLAVIGWFMWRDGKQKGELKELKDELKDLAQAIDRSTRQNALSVIALRLANMASLRDLSEANAEEAKAAIKRRNPNEDSTR